MAVVLGFASCEKKPTGGTASKAPVIEFSHPTLKTDNADFSVTISYEGTDLRAEWRIEDPAKPDGTGIGATIPFEKLEGMENNTKWLWRWDNDQAKKMATLSAEARFVFTVTYGTRDKTVSEGVPVEVADPGSVTPPVSKLNISFSDGVFKTDNTEFSVHVWESPTQLEATWAITGTGVTGIGGPAELKPVSTTNNWGWKWNGEQRDRMKGLPADAMFVFEVTCEDGSKVSESVPAKEVMVEVTFGSSGKTTACRPNVQILINIKLKPGLTIKSIKSTYFDGELTSNEGALDPALFKESGSGSGKFSYKAPMLKTAMAGINTDGMKVAGTNVDFANGRYTGIVTFTVTDSEGNEGVGKVAYWR